MWQKLGAEYKPVVSGTCNQDWQWTSVHCQSWYKDKDTKTRDKVEYFDYSCVDEDKVYNSTVKRALRQFIFHKKLFYK